MSRWLRALVAALVILLAAGLSGCWDDRELNTLYIVTGLGLDAGEQPGQARFTVQLGKIVPSSSSALSSSSGSSPAILLGTDADTLLNALQNFGRMTSRTMFLHHNQVVVFGRSLAEKGIEPYMDFLLRDHEAREEVPLVVADDKAADILSVELEQDKISGEFLGRMLHDMAVISPYYSMRTFDFASKLFDGIASAVVPIVQVIQVGSKKKIEMSGMAVFKRDKMVGSLSITEAQGYIWAMGGVNRSVVSVPTEKGVANLYAVNIATKRTMALKPEGGVQVHLSVSANLVIGELSGFQGMSIEELMAYLTEQAQITISARIVDCVQRARAMDADIYGFCDSLHKQYPKTWHSLQPRWDEEFRNVGVFVEAQVHIRETGQIVQSLQMEDGQP